MNKLIRSAAFVLFLVPSVGAAEDFDKGFAAYEAGDFVKALKEWRPLAEQGNAMAQSALGDVYALGQGLPQDYAEAAHWYRLAAEQGLNGAQASLGAMDAEGAGLPQDYIKAHMWPNIAAANGLDATSMRDNIAKQMTQTDISEAQQRATACMGSGYNDCGEVKSYRWWWPW